MKVTIESWDKKSNKLVLKVRQAALKLGRLLGMEDSYAEIYLVGKSFMDKNVLSFPAPKKFPRPDIGKKYKYLGEIYLNPDYIAKEHLEITEDKLRYMLIHGFLHLLGYDHKKKDDIIRMEKKEARLLEQLHKQ